MRDLQYWRNLVQSSVRTSNVAEIEEIAEACYQKEQQGILTCVWHEACRVKNSLDLCQCAPCVDKRNKLKAA